MKDKNLLVKKCAAADCSTKQNRVAICPVNGKPGHVEIVARPSIEKICGGVVI
jgi:hypothetical protein